MPNVPHLKLLPTAPADDAVKPAMTLAQLYREHSSYVAYIGIRILGRDDEIDDLVQDVFVDACKGLRTVRDADAVKGWLATITVRAATRRLRTRKFKRFLGLASLTHDVVWPGASPEECAAIARVYQRLESVSPRRRAAWVLRVVEQEPLAYVANVCGCSLATAKRWIHETGMVVTGEAQRSDDDEP
ncbi:MAG: sigma-70 family RNA polymerase sigma factor [Deltaproteobacteria bacterium]|nr:sigma-70 family RNA polymerase sigma factor [Deltaproteobacteria bacterium]